MMAAGPVDYRTFLPNVTYKRKPEEIDKARQLVENLWGFGPPDSQIGEAMQLFKTWERTGQGSYQDLLNGLTRLGIDGTALGKSERLSNWRANPKDSFKDRVRYLFKDGFGGGDEEWWRVSNLASQIAADEAKAPGGTIRPGGSKAGDAQEFHYIEAMRRVLAPETFTNAMIKMRAGDKLSNDKVRGAAPPWNPWRGDAPKKAQPYVGPAEGQRPQDRYPEKPGATGTAESLQTLPAGVGGGAGGAGGGGGGAGGGLGAGTLNQPAPPRTPEEKIAYIKKHYGGQAWYLDIPEVRDKLFEAAAKEMPASEVVEQLKGTRWWQVTDAKQRAWYAYERDDPETARVDIGKQAVAVNKAAAAAGVTLTPDRAKQIAESYLRNGWGPDELNQAIASEFYYDPEDQKGGATVDALKATAREYMVPLSEDAMKTWGRDLIAGTSTEDQYREFLKEQAKSLFPQLSSALDRGETVSKYMDGFFEMAKNTLGISKEAIDLNDQKWLRPLHQVNDKGERQVMSLDQWQTVLRTDERYGYNKTQQARNEAADLATSLIKTFKGV